MGRVYEALRRRAERTDANENADGTSANGTSADITNADVRNADITNADVRNADVAPLADSITRAAEASHSAIDIKAPAASSPVVSSPAASSPVVSSPAASSSSVAHSSAAPHVALEQAMLNSTIFQSSPTVASGLPHGSAARHISASDEHTEQAAGTALPGSHAARSRAAGATSDAVRSTRAETFPALEIVSARVEPHLVTITAPHSPHAERFRSLRTRVLHAGERRGVQTIVITSSNIMEGKTVTALNLAWQLAQADGVRALLIDGDLRHPCCAEYLALDAPAGLSEVLAGEASLTDSIVRIDPAGLHLLPGGTRRDDVADLLSGPRFSAVLAEARTMFDYIIIDAPPLGIFTDAAVLMNRADAALLVIRAGKVRYAQLDRLLEGLPQDRILGVILNGADERMNESDYYYYRRGEDKRGSRGGRRRQTPSSNKEER